MAMNKIPTLVIGLGGIGCRIAAGVNNLLSEEDRKHVGLLGIDTNTTDIQCSQANGLHTIRIGDNRSICEYLEEHMEYTKWFPVHPLLIYRGMSTGAGQIRTISRLASLASEETGQFLSIKSEIDRIRDRSNGGNTETIAVVITGSITGGTGAGMFLQIPYYIRNVLKKTAGLKNVIIRGIFLSPDITADLQPSAINRDAVKVNAYTCLKELNALYLSQRSPEYAKNISFEYYDEVKQGQKHVKINANDMLEAKDKKVLNQKIQEVPYNYLYLVEKTDKSGTLGNPEISTIEDLMSKTIFTLMFTPVNDSSLSVEDNFTLSQMEANYMNRYAGTGICRLRFPKELAQEYVTLSTVRDLVTSEWRLIDIMCNNIVKEAYAQRQTDGQTEIPDYGKKYCEMFSAEVKDNTERKLGHLFSEAYIKGENERSVISLAEFYFEKIAERINTVLQDEDIVAQKSKCVLNEDNMTNYVDAEQEIITLENALYDYEKLANTVFSSKSNALPNDFFPVNWEIMQNKVDSEYCIYKYLANVHPLTARNFCYELIDLLNSKIDSARSDLASLKMREFVDADFDDRQDGVQNPKTALDNIRTRKKNLLTIFQSERTKMSALVDKLIELSDKQRANIGEWLEYKLYIRVCEVLLGRVKKLSDKYKLFFDTIEDRIEDTRKRLADIEISNETIGSKHIYSSKDALRKMASEYTYSKNATLPDDTKSAIFKELFRIVSTEFDGSMLNMSEAEKQKRDQINKEALLQIFKNAVENTIKTDVLRTGNGIVNLTAREALNKEFELISGENRETALNLAEYNNRLTAYARKRVEEAMKQAAPSLATSDGAEANNSELVFFAIHPDCAEIANGVPNKGATKDYYFPVLTAATDNIAPTILMDEEFDPSEMVCMKNKYLYVVEDLVKFARDGEYYKLYNERIDNINSDIDDPANEDAFKTVTTPHFHRFWHQEGFICPLTEDERIDSARDTRHAFIYGIGYGLVERNEDEEARYIQSDSPMYTWYDKTTAMVQKITKCFNTIGASYYDLLDALDFNRTLKRNILAIATAKSNKNIGYRSNAEVMEKLFDYELIKNIVEKNNIYDIMLELRDNLEPDKYSKMFEAILECIWSFTSDLFKENALFVNQASISILEKIFENSKLGKKISENASLSQGDELSLKFAERQLVDIHKALLEQRFFG